MQERTHTVPKPASQAFLTRMQVALHAIRRVPHGALRLVQAMSAWSVKTRRAASRRCRDARVYGHTATAMHDVSPPTPPAIHTRESVYCCIGTAEREAKFQQMKRDAARNGGAGSFFAFHGSPAENWHGILHLGLKNISGACAFVMTVVSAVFFVPVVPKVRVLPVASAVPVMSGLPGVYVVPAVPVVRVWCSGRFTLQVCTVILNVALIWGMLLLILSALF